jgi:trk system potassium uptake protein TrkH
VRPGHLFILSYVGVILIGAALLATPVSWAKGARVNPVDALFTATSAACVTGLVVKDTGHDFSLFGQIVILLLIQVGGLGLMTFSTFLVYLMGRKVALRERVLVRDSFGDLLGDDPKTLATNVLRMAFAVELIGALLLYLRFSGQLRPPQAAFAAIFHSVAAFCNAGFSLFTPNLIEYRTDALVNYVIVGLIIIGGLGFLVLSDILRHVRRRRNATARPLTLHTKMVVTVTAGLILSGALACFILEWNGTLAGCSAGTRIMASIFLSVTSRTAGFNTLDTGALSTGTLFVVMILMFIGAAPGSTGGGIKTSTFGTLVAMVRARLKRQDAVNIFRRTLPREVEDRALAVSVLSLVLVLFFMLLLLVTERESAGAQKNTLCSVAFETISAFGTVGLSTGLTPTLSTAGRLLLSTLMFIGRVGPLTVVLALAGQEKRPQYEHPREAIMIG